VVAEATVAVATTGDSAISTSFKKSLKCLFCCITVSRGVTTIENKLVKLKIAKGGIL
jgi:hypothetical protein